MCLMSYLYSQSPPQKIFANLIQNLHITQFPLKSDLVVCQYVLLSLQFKMTTVAVLAPVQTTFFFEILYIFIISII